MKITKKIIEGTEPVPAGFVIKNIEHRGFSFKNKLGKVVIIPAHTEHILVSTEKKVPAKEVPKVDVPEGGVLKKDAPGKKVQEKQAAQQRLKALSDKGK